MSLIHLVKMKLMCFLLCVAYTSNAAAQSLNAIDSAILQILQKADSNSFELDLVLRRNESTDSTILGHIEAMKERVFARIKKMEGRTLRKVIAIQKKIRVITRMVSNDTETKTEVERPFICTDLQLRGITKSGVYNAFVGSKEIQVYCDMDTDGGGWMVFQRRRDGSVNFNRKWNSYRNGFGDLENEFWLGNENLYQMIQKSGKGFELRIDLKALYNNEIKYAKYTTFSIGNIDRKYKLTVSGYSGDAGDSLSYHNGQPFSAKDSDNDASDYDCASSFGAAWWYKACFESNLNLVYLNGHVWDPRHGVVLFKPWKTYPYPIKFTEMKIRPKHLE